MSPQLAEADDAAQRVEPDPKRSHPRLGLVLGLVAAVLAAVLVSLGLVMFVPWLDSDLSSRPDPAASFEEAHLRFADLRAEEGADIRTEGRSLLMVHEGPTPRVVVLYHGYTNVPKQMRALAKAYYDAGYNVLVPRLPGHGYRDRLGGRLSEVTPSSLVQATDRSIDIAAGLGDSVTVTGISGGATMAAWAASERNEVVEANLLAPLVTPAIVPERFAGSVARLGRVLPDIHLWWDPSLKAALATPPYAYSRYSIRSLGAFLAVGRYVDRKEPGRRGPLDRLLLVLNDNDDAISNSAALLLYNELRPSATSSHIYRFKKGLGLRHDIIDPNGENRANLPLIYPVLARYLALPALVSE